MTMYMQAPPLVGHIRICETDDMTDEELAHAFRAFKRAEALLDQRRGELFTAIGGAVLDRGIRQADVARQTGYTREHIRRITDAIRKERTKAAGHEVAQ